MSKKTAGGLATGAGICGRAMLVNLSIKTWEARKTDAKATATVQSTHGVSNEGGAFSKKLLPGATEYAELMTRCRAFRQENYRRTLPWGDEKSGWRLLAAKDYIPYTQWVRSEEQAISQLADRLSGRYQDLQQLAKRHLNGIFDSANYPTDIRERFSVTVDFAPIPAAGDIRVELGAEQIAAIEASVTVRVQQSVEVAMGEAWKRLHTCVAKMAERLNDNAPGKVKKDGSKTFRDTLTENAVDLCAALKTLNLTDDPDLERMRARVEHDLSKLDPEQLRDDKTARAEAAEKAQDILTAMAGFMPPAPKAK